MVIRDSRLAPDRRGDGGDRILAPAAQHLFERLQLVHAIQAERGFAEHPAFALDRDGQIRTEFPAHRPHYPSARQQITDPQPVAVEQREEQENPAPAQCKDREKTVGQPLRRLGGEEAERQEHFDLAHRVARDDRAAGQPRPVAGHHAQTHHALARRRAAPAHFEQRKPAVAQHEKSDQPQDSERRLLARHQQQGDHDRRDDQQDQHRKGVDHEGRRAHPCPAELDLQIDPLGRDEGPSQRQRSLWPLGLAITPEPRHCGSSANRNRATRQGASSARCHSG